MDFLLDCPKCGTEQWFEKVEYSDEHLIVVCVKCKVRLQTDLKFVEVEK